MLNKNKRRIRVIRDVSSSVAFLFLAFTMYQILFPAVSSEAASTATAEIEVEVAPVIEMAIDKTSVALAYNNQTEILPTSSGVTATGEVNVYVTTNDTDGYDLKVYTQDTTNSMTHSNSNVQTAISPTTGGTSLSANTWGVKYGEGSWMAVGANSSNATNIASESKKTTSLCSNIAANYSSCYSSGAAKKNTVTFGANITDALPAGTYTNNVVFTAITKTVLATQ